MKKIILGLLVAVLFVPALALAEQDEGWTAPARSGRPARARKGKGKRIDLKELRGEIVSLSKDEVTIASGTKDKPEQIEVRISEHRAELIELLAQGFGRKAELLCRKTPQGAWTLVRINGIEGVDISDQPALLPGLREKSHHRFEDLSPEQREERMERLHKFLAKRLKDKPELREELEQLAKDDPEAFRQRARELMHELQQRRGGGRGGFGGGCGGYGGQWGTPVLPEGFGGPRMPGTLGSPMMGRMGPGQGMAPWGQGKRRFSPQSEEVQKLERQTHELAEQYRRAQGQGKDELAEKLQVALSDIFEKKAQAQVNEVERLEKQLEELRSRLERRQENREAIIQRRFEKLTGQEDDELTW